MFHVEPTQENASQAKGCRAHLQKAAHMSKHALTGTLVLCFVCTFLTMIYLYGRNGYKYENSLPEGAHGHHQSATHSSEGHQASPSPTAPH